MKIGSFTEEITDFKLTTSQLQLGHSEFKKSMADVLKCLEQLENRDGCARTTQDLCSLTAATYTNTPRI